MEQIITTDTSAPGVDFITMNDAGAIRALGSTSQRLLSSGFSVQALRTCDVLRKEEWLELDTAVIEISRQRLVGVADLLDRGLRMDLQNGLGTTQIQWQTMSDMTPAEVDMAGVTEGQRDRVVFNLKTMPIPLIH